MFMSQDTEKQSFKLDSSVSNKNPIANSKNQSDYSAYLSKYQAKEWISDQ